MNAAEEKYTKVNPNYLLHAYGITLAQWIEVFKHQGEVCAICKRGLRPGSHWHTDHDHKTGLFRGILCSQCNRALGKIEDPRWQWRYQEVHNAGLYLEHSPAQSAGVIGQGFPGKIGTDRFRKWVSQKFGVVFRKRKKRRTN